MQGSSSGRYSSNTSRGITGTALSVSIGTVPRPVHMQACIHTYRLARADVVVVSIVKETGLRSILRAWGSVAWGRNIRHLSQVPCQWRDSKGPPNHVMLIVTSPESRPNAVRFRCTCLSSGIAQCRKEVTSTYHTWTSRQNMTDDHSVLSLGTPSDLHFGAESLFNPIPTF